jgi:hypothetical protein
MLLKEEENGFIRGLEGSRLGATCVSLCDALSLQMALLEMQSRAVYSDPDTLSFLCEQNPGDEFFFNAQDYSTQILRDYFRDSQSEAERARKRLYRKLIRSTAVSMAGHLSFLMPRYQQVSMEATAKEEVIHFEGITLAEEHGRMNLLREVIRRLRFGWRLCTKLRHKLSISGTQFWPMSSGSRYTSGGLVRALPA